MRHPHKRTGRLSHRARQKIELARRAEYEAIQAERALRAQQAYEVMCARLRGERPAGGPPGLPVEGLVPIREREHHRSEPAHRANPSDSCETFRGSLTPRAAAAHRRRAMLA